MIRKDREEILIVEDSLTQAERLRFVLEQHGYQVITAHNGREAADLLARHKPRLVISDVIMPEMDGFQLCRFMRTDDNLKSIPVILLTALSDPVDVMKALECGADNFIIKPFEESQLINRVQLFLLNQDLRKSEGVQVGLEINFQGQKYFINSDRLQILNLLLSTYEAAVDKNAQLLKTQKELQHLAEELEAQGEELQVQNEELQELTATLQDSEARTQRQARILAAINRVFHEALTCETEEELGRTCLAVAEELTGSKFGFLGEVNPEGMLDDIAISAPGWTLCRMPAMAKPILPKALHVRGIFGKVIKDEQSVIANDPAAHPDKVGTPEGHPALTAFLGMPLKQAGKTIGMLGLGNKPGGYDLEDQEAAEALAPGIVESFLRKRAEARIKELNEELLANVRQLEFANQELESFSYSVSHDLKAPIRAIQGFSRMLVEEHSPRLDEEGLRLLNVIVSNTQIMANLIDDLLALSRLGRHQIVKSPINLAAMARQVFERLREQEPGREIILTVQEPPRAWGDPSLLNQAMMNLLGNAVKYTRAQKTAAIEVGGFARGKETVYYVKDNGVGFDESYAHKLFGVFQRLHGGQEYEGTGVGLAIVQRIIKRHGGRVWAEGQVGEGATFYFSLPKNED